VLDTGDARQLQKEIAKSLAIARQLQEQMVESSAIARQLQTRMAKYTSRSQKLHRVFIGSPIFPPSKERSISQTISH
jgi:hypothetical protein